MNWLNTKLNNNSTYYISLFFIIFFNSLISYDNITFNLYFNHLYEDYANFFKTLDPNSLKYPNSTFPLWGYGLFHLFGQTVILNLIFQQGFTYINLIILDRFILNYKFFKNISIYRLITLLSSSWFLFHTQMWPKSIASNLLLLAIIFILKYFKSKDLKLLIYSGICFGILHNFRSDYLYLSIVITIFILIIEDKSIYKKLKSSLFIFVQILLLIPWMMFTNMQIGKPIPTSTNSGHVLFIGLGQLPGNKWGITPHDKDPVKTSLLIKRFGDKYKYIDYEAWNGINEDQYLKEVFLNYVKEDPIEWIRKCAYAARLLVLDPFYVGNVGNFQQNKISNIDEIRQIESYFYNFKFKNIYKLILSTNWKIDTKEIFQLLYTIYTKIFGIIVFSSFLITFLLSLLQIIKRKIIPSNEEILLSIIIFYQIAISIFAFHMPVYNSTIYIIYLLLTYLLFQKYLSIKQ